MTQKVIYMAVSTPDDCESQDDCLQKAICMTVSTPDDCESQDDCLVTESGGRRIAGGGIDAASFLQIKCVFIQTKR